MKMYKASDGDLSVLGGKTVSVLGYGNQGAAWAKNLRDGGVRVVVGSIQDDSFAHSIADGFETSGYRLSGEGCGLPSAPGS